MKEFNKVNRFDVDVLDNGWVLNASGIKKDKDGYEEYIDIRMVYTDRADLQTAIIALITE